MRKTVFGISDQVGLDPICSGNVMFVQADLHLDCPPMANAGFFIM